MYLFILFLFTQINIINRRAQDNKLELIDLCFEQELQNNCIRIYFPRHLIPAISVVEYKASNEYVCVFVLTAGNFFSFILFYYIFKPNFPSNYFIC